MEKQWNDNRFPGTASADLDAAANSIGWVSTLGRQVSYEHECPLHPWAWYWPVRYIMDLGAQHPPGKLLVVTVFNDLGAFPCWPDNCSRRIYCLRHVSYAVTRELDSHLNIAWLYPGHHDHERSVISVMASGATLIPRKLPAIWQN